ncbi:MAG: hypothetical protein QM743_09315 [Chitinophagaceae bacterium]
MGKLFIGLLLALLLGITGYIYWFYYRSYGDGLREGYFQKFSRKGNIFKSYEGELLLDGFGPRRVMRNASLSANYFYFSVVDEAIADSLERCVGKVVTLHYTQYLRSLPWRGDNYNGRNSEKGQYIADRIVKVEEFE